jgi:hypothetical protein
VAVAAEVGLGKAMKIVKAVIGGWGTAKQELTARLKAPRASVARCGHTRPGARYG